MQHAYGLDIPITLEDACDPARLALIVYDMQVGVVGQITGGAEITGRVLEVLESARAAGIRVFFTRHMSLANEVSGASALRTAMTWQRVSSVTAVRPPLLRGSAAFELIPELQPRNSEAVLDKISMSAFIGTPLDIVLRDCGISAFAIAGVAMEVGIEPTVRHGTDLGYLPIVIHDACGAGKAAAAERSLAALRYAGNVVLSDSATFRTALQPHGATNGGRAVPAADARPSR